MAPPQDVDPGLEQRLLTAMNECTQKLGSKISLALDKQGARIDALERLVHFDAETCADPLEQFAAEVEALKAGERRTRSGRAMQLDTLDKVAGAVTRGVTSKATTRGDDGGQGRKSEGQGRKSEGRKSEGQGRKAERVEHIPLRVLEPAPSPAKMTPRAKAKAGAKAKAAVKAAAKVKVEPNGKAANGGANVAANGRGKKPNGEANGASAKRKRAAEAAEAPEKVADEWLVNDGDFAYVGERIARCFGAIIVTGNVTGYVAQDEDPAHLWHVKHDDGDSEDLEQYEVVEGLRRYAENAAERSRRAQRGDLVAALRQRRLSFFGARSAEATAADAVADGAAAAAAAADVQAQWAVAHAPSHSRALVLER
ncbi:hypothetical protein M885DRAFT_500660 [Pelagophyceae sp. CCMP2097]|nr:hypothetical protein M885DRAFT_500660 [Pelagophyceae sp. CCMP2097]